MECMSKNEEGVELEVSKEDKIETLYYNSESVLFHGSESWTLTKNLTKQIDGCYTRMLRMALNISWRSHPTHEQLYGELPKVSEKVQQRIMRLSGHCIRHNEEMANRVILWKPTEGRTGRVRRRVNYVDNWL